MAENDPKPADSPKPADNPRSTRTPATTDEPVNPDEVEIDERYVGIDPIYANSAYEEPLEPEAPSGKDVTDEEKEAAEAEVAMLAKVKENEAGCVVNVDEPVPFSEWVEGTDAANRKSNISGVDQERVEADKAKTEEALNEEGRVPPRSTSTHQPGVNTVT